MSEIEMIERVARAIYAKWDERTSGDAVEEIATELARAAVEAMREPTKWMIDAGGGNNSVFDAKCVFEAMINAALKESE
jgi:ATP-dependent RNA circularization protein (DNA/RNA ligase family)